MCAGINIPLNFSTISSSLYAEIDALCAKYHLDKNMLQQWYDGYQLGDENETMLRKALELAGKTYPMCSTRAEHSNTFMKSLRVERRSLSIDSHSSKLHHKALDPK